MNFAGSGSQKGFQVQSPNFRMRSSGGFGAAAGMTDTAGVFQANRQRAPKYDQQSATDMATRAAERNAITKAEAQTHAQGLQSIASVKSAKMIADAQVAAAEKQAGAAKSSAMMSGIGSIAGAALGLLSDETTKTNIERIDDALTTLRELRPVTFHYSEEFSTSPERMHHGFIAQDYARVMPDATYYDESMGKMCIDTGDLIGLLVRAVQQLETRVMCLEAEKALAGVK